MIIGNGDIGTALKEAGIDREDMIFFASGVSNSKETRRSEYDREWNLLEKQSNSGNRWDKKHLVYFSSLCIYYADTEYAMFKRFMESEVQRLFEFNTIVRLGNISWGNNPHTIINHFKKVRTNLGTPELQDTYRYVVGKDEFIHWMRLIKPGTSTQMNIPGEFIHVKNIWRKVVNGEY